jgi:hypothetical protein
MFLLPVSNCFFAQEIAGVDAAAYIKTITQRSGKIISVLDIQDSSKFYRVQNILVQQYSKLNAVHNTFNATVKKFKADTTADKNSIADKIKIIEEKRLVALAVEHKAFLSSLSKEINEKQIVQIKDGMTYNVLPITYKGYQEMLLNLTETQKNKIYGYLVEAREFAMDAESSEKKHAWFGKYKGKINNYLSAEGYDMNKESKDWANRVKEAKQQKINN